jgi:hypothetical protein
MFQSFGKKEGTYNNSYYTVFNFLQKQGKIPKGKEFEILDKLAYTKRTANGGDLLIEMAKEFGADLPEGDKAEIAEWISEQNKSLKSELVPFDDAWHEKYKRLQEERAKQIALRKKEKQEQHQHYERAVNDDLDTFKPDYVNKVMTEIEANMKGADEETLKQLALKQKIITGFAISNAIAKTYMITGHKEETQKKSFIKSIQNRLNRNTTEGIWTTEGTKAIIAEALRVAQDYTGTKEEFDTYIKNLFKKSVKKLLNE